MRNLGLISFFIIMRFLEGCSCADAPKGSKDHSDLKYFLRQATILNATDSGHYFSLPASPFLFFKDSTVKSDVPNRIEIPDSIASKYFITDAVNDTTIYSIRKFIDYVEHIDDFIVIYSTYAHNINKAITYAIVINSNFEVCSRLIIAAKDRTQPMINFINVQTFYSNGTYFVEFILVGDELEPDINNILQKYARRNRANYKLNKNGEFTMIDGTSKSEVFTVKSMIHDKVTGFIVVK